MIVRFGAYEWDLEVTSISTDSDASVDKMEFLDGSFYRQKFPSDIDRVEITCQWVDINTERQIKAAFESVQSGIFYVPSIESIEPMFAIVENCRVDYKKLVPNTTRLVDMSITFTKQS